MYNTIINISSRILQIKISFCFVYVFLQPFNSVFAAPGAVSDFDIVLHFDGSFKLIQLRWKLPPLLDRNGIIQEFLLVDNSTLQVGSKIF